MTFMSRGLLALVLGFTQAVVSVGAPSLPVAKPFVSPTSSLTGPTNDAYAGMGQWFKSVTTNTTENRTHEFYDNTPASGGAMGCLAISGVVVNVQTVSFPFPGITAFDVQASVFNDSASQGASACTNGTNSHSETLTAQFYYTNILKQAILVAEFGTCGIVAGNAANDPAYTDFSPYLVAVNHDYEAWFGTTAENRNQDGNFFVPGWDLGDLAPGQSTNRILSFVVLNFSGGADKIPAGDPRYQVIMNSYNNQTDIFLNRTPSLKISNWIATLAEDDGSDYPLDSGTGAYLGNVSVFHNAINDGDSSATPARITQFQYSAPFLYINSVGKSGVAMQVVQATTNLISQNWVNLATNWAWPAPLTNHWTNTTLGGAANFIRIVQ